LVFLKTDMVSREEVELAYRFILGREPESDIVVSDHSLRYESLPALRKAFLESAEFQSRVVRPPAFEADQGPALSIDIALSPAVLNQMFQRVEGCWQALGQKEPYWSVLSSDQFRSAAFNVNSGAFYDSGRRDTERLLAWLTRNHIEPQSIHSCSEYGCGVGRVTNWLCCRFPQVFAYDISEPHLQLARQHLSNERRSNVTFCRIDTIAALSALEPADLVFTIIVLQHNPPPVMAHVLRMLLRSLKPRGLAYFQAPTYAIGYRFDAKQYLKSSRLTDSFEMHVLPQSSIFRIVRDEGCAVLEVQPDFYVGDPNWVSNTFLVQRA
jgi:SAM-dependent methyltransferase